MHGEEEISQERRRRRCNNGQRTPSSCSSSSRRGSIWKGNRMALSFRESIRLRRARLASCFLSTFSDPSSPISSRTRSNGGEPASANREKCDVNNNGNNEHLQA